MLVLFAARGMLELQNKSTVATSQVDCAPGIFARDFNPSNMQCPILNKVKREMEGRYDPDAKRVTHMVQRVLGGK